VLLYLDTAVLLPENALIVFRYKQTYSA
jgi:hypothetical protein